MLTRRFFVAGLIAAPLVVQVDRLMPLRGTPYDPWVQFQTWPIGTPQPFADVLDSRGNTVTRSFGGLMRLSTLNAQRAKWEAQYGRLFTILTQDDRGRPGFGLSPLRLRYAPGGCWKTAGNFTPYVPHLDRSLRA